MALRNEVSLEPTLKASILKQECFKLLLEHVGVFVRLYQLISSPQYESVPQRQSLFGHTIQSVERNEVVLIEMVFLNFF